jgi:hypothetical protein
MCVFDDKIGTAGEIGAKEIINNVKKSNYADKRFLLYVYECDKKWDLTGWKELNNK